MATARARARALSRPGTQSFIIHFLLIVIRVLIKNRPGLRKIFREMTWVVLEIKEVATAHQTPPPLARHLRLPPPLPAASARRLSPAPQPGASGRRPRSPPAKRGASGHHPGSPPPQPGVPGRRPRSPPPPVAASGRQRRLSAPVLPLPGQLDYGAL